MFADRTEAGEALADRLAALDLADPVVLALLRGGVPVAMPVTRRLRAPLDLLMVRKIGVPGHEELAVGAVVNGAGYRTVFNAGVLRSLGMSEADFAPAVTRKLAEIAERRARYLGDRAPVPVAGRTAVVVDDGIATGATMRAALMGLAARGPAAIVLAIPVAPPDVVAVLDDECDRVLCLEMPDPFLAVGAHYRDFDQVADDTVLRLIAEAGAQG